jgi:hypothetical protein
VSVQEAATPHVFNPDSGLHDLPGIPFYKRRAVYRQTSLWQQVFYRVTLILARQIYYLDKDGAPKVLRETPSLMQVVTGRSGLEHLAELRRQTVALNQRAGSLKALIAAFDNVPAPPTKEDSEPQPAGNFVDEVNAIDYSRVLYINAPAPAFGEGHLDAHINSDGTLGESASSVTPGADKLVTALTSVFPISDFLSAKFIPRTKEETEETRQLIPGATAVPPPKTQAQEVAVTATLEIQPVGFVYEVTRDHSTDPRTCGGREACTLAALKLDVGSGLYRVTPLGANEPKPKKSEEAGEDPGKRKGKAEEGMKDN